MTKKRRPLTVNEPLRHRCHSAPVTRRDFLRQGFLTGTGAVLSGGVFSLFSNPRAAYAAVSSDLDNLAGSLVDINGNSSCSLGGVANGAGKIPFICFDLAGGANFAGSNVLVGQAMGQMDFLGTNGYNKMGLPGDIIPGLSDTGVAGTMLNSSDGDFTNSQLGLRFHSDSPLLRGILDKYTPVLPGEVDGAVIAARSDNDTGNNPHNPMYGIARAGAQGGVVTLIGSRSSESGGNSMSPASLIDPEIRPTKVDRPSDVTGMVDVGDLTAVLSDPADVTAVMESMARISHKELDLSRVAPGVDPLKDAVIKDLVRCGYLRAADIAERFAGVDVDPEGDTNINGGIFTNFEFLNDSEFRKTASVMKMVIDGHAGAGSITMGGYDYHTGDRQTGENRDLRAGRCIGACLQYASIMRQKLMIYVFSDGSVASNGALDNSTPMGSNELGGRGKGEWTGDNSSTACSFYLVFDPNGGVSSYANTNLVDYHQVGRFTSDGSVITSSSPAANNVNLLVNTVIANYMSINGDLAEFNGLFGNALGDIDNVISFGAIPP
jgi:hypothetical protein